MLALAVCGACGGNSPLAARLSGGPWSGLLATSAGRIHSLRNGFDPLEHTDFPGRSLFGAGKGGFFFEYIMDGSMVHRTAAEFSPARNVHVLEQVSAATATLRHPAHFSSWNLDCAMEFHLSAEGVDLEFTATPRSGDFPHGYLLLMWANYMDHAQARQVHFFGVDQRDAAAEARWRTFGDDTENGFETGALAHAGAESLGFDRAVNTINIQEDPHKRFTVPVFYGLLDGDGTPETSGDSMAFVMMFDQADPIRFSLWNFTRERTSGQPDPTRPAWDWQYIIRNPRVGHTTRYRARVLYLPFRSEAEIMQRYHDWSRSTSRGSPR